MSRIAIIPARGGSKRIPRKNIKNFLGKPIISYPINAALESGLFDEVMVSTDDEEIAEIATFYGAKIPFLRSAINSNDFATTIDVISEVINYYNNQNRIFDIGCCIYPSAPFITAKMLVESYSYLIKSNLDCVFPAIKYGHPIQRALVKNKNGTMSMLYSKYLETRSQDLETRYHDAGQFYCFNIQSIIKEHKLWTKNTGILILDEILAHDIDNVEDWQIAEYKYQYLVQRKLI